jgi:NADH-quinone oxidoreductase subunit J
VSEFWFYLLAGMTVSAAVGVVMMRNPVHSALSLVVTLFLLAVNYIALQAHLVAALQIIVPPSQPWQA